MEAHGINVNSDNPLLSAIRNGDLEIAATLANSPRLDVTSKGFQEALRFAQWRAVNSDEGRGYSQLGSMMVDRAERAAT